MAEIVSSSDTLGGKPRIKGTRVSAEQIYEMYSLRDMDKSKIAEQLPTVDREGVDAAIKFMEEYGKSEEGVKA